MHNLLSHSVLLFGNDSKFDPGIIYDVSLFIHSISRYLILILMLYSIFTAWKGWKSNHPFSKKPALFTLILVDIQLILGIYMWILNIQNITGNFSQLKRFMKAPPDVRFTVLEHPIMMAIAILLIHIGYSKAKKAGTDGIKNKRIFIFYLIALVIILASIPWPFMHPNSSWVPGI